MMTTRGTVKIKTLEGEHKQTILGDGADGEEYIKHLMSFDHLMEKKEHSADLAEAAKAVLKASLTLKKHAKVPVGVYIVQTVSYGRRMNRGQTAS